MYTSDAFQSQFQHSFVTASAETAWKGSTGINEYTNPEVEKPDYGSGSIQHASVINSGIMQEKVASGGGGVGGMPAGPPMHNVPPPGYNEEAGTFNDDQTPKKRKRRSRWDNSD